MNKKEAIEQMRQGKRVTHELFSDDEWMTFSGTLILTEDGYTHKPGEFWKYRTEYWWDNGYSLYIGKIDTSFMP